MIHNENCHLDQDQVIADRDAHRTMLADREARRVEIRGLISQLESQRTAIATSATSADILIESWRSQLGMARAKFVRELKMEIQQGKTPTLPLSSAGALVYFCHIDVMRDALPGLALEAGAGASDNDIHARAAAIAGRVISLRAELDALGG